MAEQVAGHSTTDYLQGSLLDTDGVEEFLTACEEQRTVHVAGTTTGERWSGYLADVAEHGVRSILAVPFTLEAGARAALNVYSSQPGAFGPEDIATAETFVAQTSKP